MMKISSKSNLKKLSLTLALIFSCSNSIHALSCEHSKTRFKSIRLVKKYDNRSISLSIPGVLKLDPVLVRNR
ncbi:hypothetical protein A9Q84_00215 [Halobacteriovorax marinus]|uniref:Lipoprotein n=1 Tax=Halobacteriovorax marinus TaxID=97084 RepID=A0A1Y5FDA0_9BACT|nr:hypothetical protein A9Q84_00215 [Halobacteriovorax marinus]